MPTPSGKPRTIRWRASLVLIAVGFAVALVIPSFVRYVVRYSVDRALAEANLTGLRYELARVGLCSAEIVELRPTAAGQAFPRIAAIRVKYSPLQLLSVEVDSIEFVGLDLVAKLADGKLSLGALDPLLAPSGTAGQAPKAPRFFKSILLTSSTLAVEVGGRQWVVPLDAAITRTGLSTQFDATLRLPGSNARLSGGYVEDSGAFRNITCQLRAELSVPELASLLPQDNAGLRVSGQRALIDVSMQMGTLESPPLISATLHSKDLALSYGSFAFTSDVTASLRRDAAGEITADLSLPLGQSADRGLNVKLTMPPQAGPHHANATADITAQTALPPSLQAALMSAGIDARALTDITLNATAKLNPDLTPTSAEASLRIAPSNIRLIGIAAGTLAAELSANLTTGPAATHINLKQSFVSAGQLSTVLLPPGITATPAHLEFSIANATLELQHSQQQSANAKVNGHLSLAVPNISLFSTAQLSGLQGVLPIVMTASQQPDSLTATVDVQPGATFSLATAGATRGGWQLTNLAASVAGSTVSYSPAGTTASLTATLAPTSAILDALNLHTGTITAKASLATSGDLTGSLSISKARVEYPPAQVAISGISANLPFELSNHTAGTFSADTVSIRGVSCPGITGTFDLTPTQVAAALDWPLLSGSSVKASGWIDVSGSRRLMGANLWIDEFFLTDLEELRQIFPPLKSVSAAGTVKLNAGLEWDGNRTFPSAEFTFRDVAINSRQHDAALTGVAGYIYLDSLLPPSSLPAQQVTVQSARFGKLNTGAGELVFRLEPPTKQTPAGSLLVERAGFEFAQGGVAARGFRLAFHDSSTELVLNADNLGLQPVLDILTDKAAGSGKLYARLPVALRFPEVTSIGRGYIYAEPGSGELSVRDLGGELRASLDASLGATPGSGTANSPIDAVRNRVLAALFNFRYDVLRADFGPEQRDNRAWVLTNLRVAGKGAPGTGEQVLDLNTNLRFTLSDLNQLLGVKQTGATQK